MGMVVSISMSKLSRVCGKEFSVGFGDEEGSNVDKNTDSTTKTK